MCSLVSIANENYGYPGAQRVSESATPTLTPRYRLSIAKREGFPKGKWRDARVARSHLSYAYVYLSCADFHRESF